MDCPSGLHSQAPGGIDGVNPGLRAWGFWDQAIRELQNEGREVCHGREVVLPRHVHRKPVYSELRAWKALESAGRSLHPGHLEGLLKHRFLGPPSPGESAALDGA